jgi:Ca-activated chloride channel homolog
MSKTGEIGFGVKVQVQIRLILFALIAWAAGHGAQAQSDLSDVHIQPRAPARSSVPALNSTQDLNTGAIRKNVDLVLVPVTVTDGSNRLITGLDRQNFQVFEEKEAQQIKHFSTEDAPVSIGIILDVSGSMCTKIERARESVIELLKSSNPQDEFFLITFADTPQLVADFTQNPDDVQNRLLPTTPKGRTSLLDAIFLGIENMKRAKYQRKALIIISDGGDNRSRYTESDIKSLVKESDVLVYSIGVFDIEFHTLEERLGPELLSEISTATGGTSYTLDNPNGLLGIADYIALQLRNQYVLGYRPNALSRNGKYRKIKIKLLAPKGISPLQVHARAGYYAPSE